MTIAVLDGALGTELGRRGLSSHDRHWYAHAAVDAPDVLASAHGAYVAAGATVHTANTFRTTARAWGPGWQRVARESVAIARRAAGPHRVAGSIAPLEDCYRPDRSPPQPEPEHRQLAEVLAHAGVDVLLCETFAHPGEALAAARAGLSTGVETWLALTAGPWADLLSPEALAVTAARAVDLGVRHVLVNCVAAARIAPYVQALAERRLSFGVYANAGAREDGFGDVDPRPRPSAHGPTRYAELATQWIAAGAQVVGGCCGIGPAHIAALARAQPCDKT